MPLRLSEIKPPKEAVGEDSHTLAVETVREQTGDAAVIQPFERDPRPVHPDPDQFKLRAMTEEECIQYANGGVVKVIKQRMQELNELISTLKPIGENEQIDEREVAMMLIAELERCEAKIPGYKKGFG